MCVCVCVCEWVQVGIAQTLLSTCVLVAIVEVAVDNANATTLMVKKLKVMALHKERSRPPTRSYNNLKLHVARAARQT